MKNAFGQKDFLDREVAHRQLERAFDKLAHTVRKKDDEIAKLRGFIDGHQVAAKTKSSNTDDAARIKDLEKQVAELEREVKLANRRTKDRERRAKKSSSTAEERSGDRVDAPEGGSS